MFLNNVGSVITSRARKTGQLATLAVGLVTGAGGCATHATQATHIAAQHFSQADRFTKNTSHILLNLELLRKSGMLTPEQLDSLLKIPSSSPPELVQAVTSGMLGLRGCEAANAQCAANAEPFCEGFKGNISECPEFKTRCGGVLKKCGDLVNASITAFTDFYRSEAAAAATDTANTATKFAK